MLKHYLIVSILSLVFLVSPAWAHPDAKQVTMMIDVDEYEPVALQFNFPAGYYETKGDDYTPGVTVFVPQNETQTSWHQQIELQDFEKLSKHAQEYLQEMKQRMQQENATFKLIDENYEADALYQTSTFTASIEKDNKIELIIVRFYSTLGKLTGVVYKKKFDSNLNDNIVKNEISYIESCIKILKS